MPTKNQKAVLPDDLSKEFYQISNLLRNQLQSILVLTQVVFCFDLSSLGCRQK